MPIIHTTTTPKRAFAHLISIYKENENDILKLVLKQVPQFVITFAMWRMRAAIFRSLMDSVNNAVARILPPASSDVDMLSYLNFTTTAHSVNANDKFQNGTVNWSNVTRANNAILVSLNGNEKRIFSDCILSHELSSTSKSKSSEVVVGVGIGIGGLDYVFDSLSDSVRRLQINHQPEKGILLYGPPGCGKTMLVGRVLEASKIRTIRISAGDIESKWPGDAERNVRDIFSLAKKLAPAVVWIDEADDLFAVRSSSNPSDSITRGYKVEFMVGMDGVLNGKGPEDRVM
ncbi:hypothetical protein ScalyP_jg9356, partial [Parmales sp. scaly parma]